MSPLTQTPSQAGSQARRPQCGEHADLATLSMRIVSTVSLSSYDLASLASALAIPIWDII